MSVRPVKAFMPPSAPASAVYASLEAILDAPDEPLDPPPYRKVLDPVGHQSGRHPRRLSPKQKDTFLGKAAERVKIEALERGGKYLRRMDTVNESGRRTRAERWQALYAVIEPFLARLDIATGVLGYLDDKGQFRLNRQNGIAEDGGISPDRLCRLLQTLEKAKYTLRKIKRLYRNGKRWVCRITIYVRPQFFIDLGLGRQHAAARKAKAKAYLKKRRQAEAAQQQAQLDDMAAAHERRMSHRGAEGSRAAKQAESANTVRIQAMQRKAGIISELAKANPGLSTGALVELYNTLHPPS